MIVLLTLNKTGSCVRGFCSRHQDLVGVAINLLHHRLLEEQADVQAEGGDEADVEEHDDRQIPSASGPLVVDILWHL